MLRPRTGPLHRSFVMTQDLCCDPRQSQLPIAMSRYQNECHDLGPRRTRLRASAVLSRELLLELARRLGHFVPSRVLPGSHLRPTCCDTTHCVTTRTEKWAVAHPASPLHIIFFLPRLLEPGKLTKSKILITTLFPCAKTGIIFQNSTKQFLFISKN